MTQYIIRRLLISIPLLLAVVFLVFLLARVLPGDPCVATLGERASEEQCRLFAIRFGLDQPLPVQFWRYLESIISGDLGVSIRFRLPVADLIVQRLPTTIELSFYALVFAIGVGVPLGIIAAYRRNSAATRGVMAMANIGISVPVFVLGLVLAWVFADRAQGHPIRAAAQWAPQPGCAGDPVGAGLGARGLGWPPPPGARLRVQHLHVDVAHHVPVERVHRFPAPPHPAGHHPGHHPARHHRADHPLQPARGDGPGLRSHGTGEGARGPGRPAAACVQERHPAHRHHHRPPGRPAAGRRGAHRDGVRARRGGSDGHDAITVGTTWWSRASRSSSPSGSCS